MENQVSSYMTNTQTTHSMTKCVCQCLPKIGWVYWTIHRKEKRHEMFLPVVFTFFTENIMTQDSVGKEWLFFCWYNQQTKVILMTNTAERITMRTNVFGLHYCDWPDWTTWNVGWITNDTMTALYRRAHWYITKCASVNQAWVPLNISVAILLSEKCRKQDRLGQGEECIETDKNWHGVPAIKQEMGTIKNLRFYRTEGTVR
jgi:hypothetical protein